MFRMPWHTTDPVNERLKFVAVHQRDAVSMSQLCEEFGISRKTGYKILPVSRKYAVGKFQARLGDITQKITSTVQPIPTTWRARCFEGGAVVVSSGSRRGF